MSYDLMIFEKNKIPTNQSDFLCWYNQKMECDNERDISSASEKIQKVFHSLRNILPPMNGLYAADNKTLSENPEMADFVKTPLTYDLHEMVPDEEMQEMAQDCEKLRKDLCE